MGLIQLVALPSIRSNTIWLGTGENNNQRSVAYGDGVYKSEDGGASWTNMGLKNSEHISKIIVDPRNSNVVYVASYGPLGQPVETEDCTKQPMAEKPGNKFILFQKIPAHVIW